MVNLNVLEKILLLAHAAKKLLTYKDLTTEYERWTGTYVHWREWGLYLARIAGANIAAGKPSLTTIVVNAKTGVPGPGLATLMPNPPTTAAGWQAEIQKVFATAY